MTKRRSRLWDGRVVPSIARTFGVKFSNNPENETISPNEAAQILGLTGEAVKQWIYAHRLPVTKLTNGYWRIRKDDLEQYLKARAEVPKRRALVAVSKGSSREHVLRALDACSVEAIISESLADGVLKASSELPALAIIEVGRHGDGWNLAARLRRTRHLRTIPVLLVSSSKLKDSEVDRALGLGAVGCLGGPLNRQLAETEVNRALNAKPAKKIRLSRRS